MSMPIKIHPMKHSGRDQRESFRIHDALPVIIRKIEDDEFSLSMEPVIEDLKELSPSAFEKENINPYLWKMLVNLNKKLDWILERLPIDLIKTKSQPINLSSTGMMIKVKNKFNIDERIRIKMLLPTLPVKEIVMEGQVVRVTASAEGDYEVAFHFLGLDEEAKNEIVHYTLNQQRKAIIAKRQQRGKDEIVEKKGR